MLYIHNIQDFNAKIAEIEIITIIRNLKRRYKIPITLSDFKETMTNFYINEYDITQMNNSLEYIRSAINKLIGISGKDDYEPENIRRAYKTLNSLYLTLDENIKFSKDIAQWINDNDQELVTILNEIPNDKTNQERVVRNNTISQIFRKLLKSNNFSLSNNNLVDDSHISKVKNLKISIKEGFLFRTHIRDFIKKNSLYCKINKIDSDKISAESNISSQSQKSIDDIIKNLDQVNIGIKVAFQNNMKIINFAVYFLAFVRWFSQEKVRI